MSEHTVARKRSRRAPASAEETVAVREEEPILSGIEDTSEATPDTSPADAGPVDPKSGLNYRLALGAVIFLGGLIVIGMGVLIVGLAMGWNHPKAPPQTPEQQALANFHKPVSMGLEPGYRILSSDTQPGRLILHVRSDVSDEIYVIDINDGHLVAIIKGEAPKQ
jgi:hypothetical protein